MCPWMSLLHIFSYFVGLNEFQEFLEKSVKFLVPLSYQLCTVSLNPSFLYYYTLIKLEGYRISHRELSPLFLTSESN